MVIKKVELIVKCNIIIQKQLLIEALEYITGDNVYLVISEAEGNQSLQVIRRDTVVAAEIAEIQEDDS